MIIRSADFITSAVQPKQFPETKIPEFAFIGRSNVGKSSLINLLTGRKLLAKISVKPGKTRTINFFSVNNSWGLVDMPGYGFARVSKTEKEKFLKMISDYLITRKQLMYLFILIDSRHKPMESDVQFIEECAGAGIPFCIVFTKIDKVSGNDVSDNISAFKQKLHAFFSDLPLIFSVSSRTGAGRIELLDFINEQIQTWSAELKKILKQP